LQEGCGQSTTLVLLFGELCAAALRFDFLDIRFNYTGWTITPMPALFRCGS
jgi:hypothetical protein